MRIADVIAMTALVICILVALIIAANLQGVTQTMKTQLNSKEFNDTADILFTNTFTGLVLASVGIIISAAVGILALVLSTLGRAAGGGVA
jgi:ABC-type Fe3+ transport system permease subunit